MIKACLLLCVLVAIATGCASAEATSYDSHGGLARRLLSKSKSKSKGRRRTTPAPSFRPAPVPVRVPSTVPSRPATPTLQQPKLPPTPQLPPLGAPQNPGTVGSAFGSVSGFIVVFAVGNGNMCFTRITGSVDNNIRRMDAGTFIELYGSVQGMAQCEAGARGVGIAVLTGQAFAEVLRRGNECTSRVQSSSQGFSNVVGSGVQVGVSGGFGGSAGCTDNKG